MNNAWSQVDLIREAFHYQGRFAGSTMVFKIDFPVTGNALFPSLVKDLALLARTGFKVVIVPGAKECIDHVLSEYGIVSSYIETLNIGREDGLFGSKIRLTAAAAMPFVEMAAFNTAARFMTGFSGSRVDAIIGNFVRARGLGVVNGIDMEHTGTVDKFYSDSVSRVLELGMVPIIPCIGWNPSGRPYNVSSDEIALAASANLGANKLFIISLTGALKKGPVSIPETIESRDDKSVIRLTPQEAESILNANRGLSGAETKPLRDLSLAVRASRAGVERIHIINGAEEGAVLRELFSNMGAGTMVYADEYESIRGLHSRDIPDILRLMEPLMQQAYLVRRSALEIQEKKEDYAVFEIDGQIRACAALHEWGEKQGEIAALASDPLYTDLGLGRRIVKYFIERARKQGMSRVFVLTTRAHDWFESLGFREAPVESLPEKKRKVYDKTRNSKVFALEL
jgi:amino-acid N-acetyltransferase